MLTRKYLLVGLAALAMSNRVLARFHIDLPPVTQTEDHMAQKRAASTSTFPPPPYVSEDPWQCVTENVTHYFLDVPQPTGDLENGINSYGGELAKDCLSTATGIDILDCSVTDPKQWCGFTTAAPSSLLSSYSTYASAVSSFWKENSASVSKLSISCPVSWDKPDPFSRSWLSIASAHAECFLVGDTIATTTTASPGTGVKTATPHNTKATTTTSKGVNLRALEPIAIVGTGLAMLAAA